MSDSGDSPVRRLVAAIDALMKFVQQRSIIHQGHGSATALTDDEQDMLFAMEADVVVLANQSGLPFERHPSRQATQGASFANKFTPTTGIDYLAARDGMRLMMTGDWDTRMRSVRAAAVAAVREEILEHRKKKPAPQAVARKGRGRPVETDPKANKRLCDDWKAAKAVPAQRAFGALGRFPGKFFKLYHYRFSDLWSRKG
jgi:hypothetical protein